MGLRKFLRLRRDLAMYTPEDQEVLCPMCNAAVDWMWGHSKARNLELRPCGHLLRNSYALTWMRGWAR